MRVQDLLQTLQGQKVPLFRNGGNLGDALIRHGTFQLCRRWGVDYFEIDERSTHQGGVLLVAGGGCCIDCYRAKLLRRVSPLLERFSEVYFLPSTICGQIADEWLQQAPSYVHVFCRERVTYDWVKERLPGRTYLDHDMATYFDFTPWLRKYPAPSGTLNAFRCDAERTKIALPEDNTDISARGHERSDPDELLTPVAMHQTIRTNRLHVALSGAFLQRDVEFYPNSYYKNRAAYRYTLSRYPNIRWMG